MFLLLAIQNQHATCRSAKNRFANLIIRARAERNLIFHILSHWLVVRFSSVLPVDGSTQSEISHSRLIGLVYVVDGKLLRRLLRLCEISINLSKKTVCLRNQE